MEREEAQLEDGSKLFRKLRDAPVGLLAGKQRPHAGQPGVAGPWQLPQGP